MAKKILLGILLVFIGASAALIFFFAKNHSVPGPVITIGGTEKKFEPTKFSLENAPSESIKGKITNRDGAIWWQSRTATEPAELLDKIPIQQGEILIASESGHLTVEFNQVLTLSLFPDTLVEVVQTLPLNLVFNQTKGVGQYQKTGDSPVSIRSLNLIVDLADGLLVVDTDEATGKIMLGLKTGVATVAYNSPEFDSKVWQLEPGDVFEYSSDERKGYFNAPL